MKGAVLDLSSAWRQDFPLVFVRLVHGYNNDSAVPYSNEGRRLVFKGHEAWADMDHEIKTILCIHHMVCTAAAYLTYQTEQLRDWGRLLWMLASSDLHSR